MIRLRLAPAATFLLSLVGAVLIYYFVSPERRKVVIPVAPLNASEGEELEVYTALIEQLYPETKGSTAVIAERTNDCPPYEKDPGWEEEMLNNMPEVGAETFGDYLLKNKVCSMLSGHAALSGRYRVVPEAEIMDVIRNDAKGWEGFYKKYPGTIGFITLSRIGFNQEMNQAFAYTGLYAGMRRASGTHILLSKKDGRWLITHKYKAWSY